MRVGGRVLISKEAAFDWRRARERPHIRPWRHLFLERRKGLRRNGYFGRCNCNNMITDRLAPLTAANTDGRQDKVMTNLHLLNSCLALLLLPLLISLAEAATLTGRAEIVDGDTIKVGSIPVRLDGIDAPEDRQTCERGGNSYACGKQATKALANLIAGQPVQCEIERRDTYGRALGICTVANTELNGSMVRGGWALAFVKYSDRYAADQAEAEKAKVGIWAGSFIKPWDWRLGEAETAQKARACAIKGNINANGEHIYHLPFQHFYSRVTIDERNGERWFCSEKEALEAGWRRALR